MFSIAVKPFKMLFGTCDLFITFAILLQKQLTVCNRQIAKAGIVPKLRNCKQIKGD
jgi:hypothetical protein